MAIQYLVVCLADFVVFPAATMWINGPDHTHPWQSLTLTNGGMYHIAMGAIVGAAVWTRTQEKLAVFNGPMGGGFASSSSGAIGSGPMPGQYQGQPGPFQPPPYQPPPPPYQPPQQPRPPQPPITDAEAQKAADLALGKP
jgi:hypothetical protein